MVLRPSHAIIATLVAAGSASAASFQNGSFETGLVGWNLSSGNAGLSSWAPTDGHHDIQWNWGQLFGDAVLSQTFDTTLGQKYRVDFDYGSWGSPGFLQQMQVEVRDGISAVTGGETIGLGSSHLNVNGNPGISLIQLSSILTVADADGSGGFSTVSFTFTALSNNSTIVFTDQTGSAGAFTDASLDNVRVSAAVPAPSEVAILSLGCLAIGVHWAFEKRRLKLNDIVDVRSLS